MNPNYKIQMLEKLNALKETHQRNLLAIGQLQLRSLYGEERDCTLTQEMRQKHSDSEIAQYIALHNGIVGFERLLHYAETRNSGQIERIAQFLAGVCGLEKGLNLESLWSLGKVIGDDMLAVLDAIRWNLVSAPDLATHGRTRVMAALQKWGYQQQ